MLIKRIGIIQGCSSPIVTKFADVQRDKVTKDAIALLTTLADSNTAQKSQYLPVLHLLQQGNCLAQSGYSMATSPPLQQMPQLHQTTPSTDINMLTFLANLASSNAVSTISPTLANQGNGINMNNARSIPGFGGPNFPVRKTYIL
jgi:hypothetical protein